MIIIKKNLTKFITIIKIIESTCIETDFIFSKDGLWLRVVDPSNISLAKIVFNKSFFDKYDISEDIICTIDMSKFLKIIKSINKKEITFEIVNDKILINSFDDKFTMNYFVGVKDDRPMPSPEFKSEWKIDSTELFSNISRLMYVGSICNFIDDNDLYVNVKQGMVNGMIKLNANKISGVKTNCYYDIEYIDKLSNLKNVFDNILLSFGKDEPCSIKAKIDELSFEWLLAPRVEENE